MIGFRGGSIGWRGHQFLSLKNVAEIAIHLGRILGGLQEAAAPNCRRPSFKAVDCPARAVYFKARLSTSSRSPLTGVYFIPGAVVGGALGRLIIGPVNAALWCSGPTR